MKVRLLANSSVISFLKRNVTYSPTLYNKPTSSATSSTISSSSHPPPSADVPGLSDAVVKYGKEPVGPGAAKNTEYKNPEYFCYHQSSYFDAEVEMLQYRLPQPSNKK
ncbi:hypothetical protein ILUMI_18856 [Ignelater luminosus]|uniref:NADH-ubiquinone oxidoreductase 9 kDa subunit n=1 Tax=Ignelater luminosus TaxID=2038154 RepID=A0A8K0CKG3_IGNLU|nr:hypothetical protein ILUMI_18856 [Ignelater luminosus]